MVIFGSVSPLELGLMARSLSTNLRHGATCPPNALMHSNALHCPPRLSLSLAPSTTNLSPLVALHCTIHSILPSPMVSSLSLQHLSQLARFHFSFRFTCPYTQHKYRSLSCPLALTTLTLLTSSQASSSPGSQARLGCYKALKIDLGGGATSLT